MTADQYRIRLALLSYKIYKKVKKNKIPHSVYRGIYDLSVEECRRSTQFK